VLSKEFRGHTNHQNGYGPDSEIRFDSRLQTKKMGFRSLLKGKCKTKSPSILSWQLLARVSKTGMQPPCSLTMKRCEIMSAPVVPDKKKYMRSALHSGS